MEPFFSKFEGLTGSHFKRINEILRDNDNSEADDLADLKRMARAGIFKKKLSARRWLFRASFMKDLLRQSGVTGYQRLTLSTTDPSLSDVMAEAVIRTENLRIAGAPVSSNLKLNKNFNKNPLQRRKIVLEDDLDDDSQSPQRDSFQIETGASFDPHRCIGAINYSMAELTSLADRYLIPIEPEETRESLCSKLVGHWSMWMAAKMRVMFNQRKCSLMERDQLINLGISYQIESTNAMSNFELCRELVGKMLELYLTAKSQQLGLDVSQSEMIAEMLSGRFNISRATEKERLAALALFSIFNPNLLQFVTTEDSGAMTAQFERVQQGLNAMLELGDAEEMDNAVSVMRDVLNDPEEMSPKDKEDEEFDHIERSDLVLYDILMRRALELGATTIYVPSKDVVDQDIPEWFGINGGQFLNLPQVSEVIMLHVGDLNASKSRFQSKNGRSFPVTQRAVDDIVVLEEFESDGVEVRVFDGLLMYEALINEIKAAIQTPQSGNPLSENGLEKLSHYLSVADIELKDNITVFAPSNEAFEEVEEIVDLDEFEQLGDLLALHVVPGNYDYEELEQLSKLPVLKRGLSNLFGNQMVYIGKNVTYGPAKIIKSFTIQSLGRGETQVHVIDAVVDIDAAEESYQAMLDAEKIESGDIVGKAGPIPDLPVALNEIVIGEQPEFTPVEQEVEIDFPAQSEYDDVLTLLNSEAYGTAYLMSKVELQDEDGEIQASEFIETQENITIFAPTDAAWQDQLSIDEDEDFEEVIDNYVRRNKQMLPRIVESWIIDDYVDRDDLIALDEEEVVAIDGTEHSIDYFDDDDEIRIGGKKVLQYWEVGSNSVFLIGGVLESDHYEDDYDQDDEMSEDDDEIEVNNLSIFQNISLIN